MSRTALPWYELLWSGINVAGEDDCWTRCGAGLSDKPHMRVNGKPRRTSILVLELKLGRPLKPGHLACHSCDHPGCHNPKHLWEGTQKENLADMTAKGRGWTGDRNGTRTHPESLKRGSEHWTALNPGRVARGDRSGRRLHPERYESQKGASRPPEANARGEKVWTAKLSADQVVDMRRKHAEGTSYADLAREYGLKRDAVVRAVCRVTWSHVP